MPGAKEVTTSVINAISFVEPGRTFSVEWLMERTGKGLTQVQGSMFGLLGREEFGNAITVIQRGRLWRLDSRPGEALKKAASQDDNLLLLEVVEKAGPHIIVKDENGQLYLLKKIGSAS